MVLEVRKVITIARFGRQLNHQLPPLYGENHLRPPEKQLPSE